MVRGASVAQSDEVPIVAYTQYQVPGSNFPSRPIKPCVHPGWRIYISLIWKDNTLICAWACFRKSLFSLTSLLNCLHDNQQQKKVKRKERPRSVPFWDAPRILRTYAGCRKGNLNAYLIITVISYGQSMNKAVFCLS